MRVTLSFLRRFSLNRMGVMSYNVGLVLIFYRKPFNLIIYQRGHNGFNQYKNVWGFGVLGEGIESF